MVSVDTQNPHSVLRNCVETLRRVATYRLPDPLDRRLLWLSENKESLGAEEREELMALVDLADQRTLDKVQAAAVIHDLGNLYPELATFNE